MPIVDDRNIGTRGAKGLGLFVPPRALLMAGIAALGLAACSDVAEIAGVENSGAAAVGACPDVSVLAEASEVYEMRGTPAPENVALHGVIGNFTGECSYRESDVEVEISLIVGGERGPALDATSASTDYFVAVVGPDGRILNKRVFDVAFDFSDSDQAATEQSLFQRIPLPNGRFSGPEYQVLLGFQLDPSELAYNRTLVSR